MRQLIPPTLRLGLSPASLELAAFDWRNRLRRSERVTVADARPDGRGVLEQLRQQLQTGSWRAGAVEVVLSSHFVRHCVLPGDARIAGAAEVAGYVRHVFRGEYGSAVDGWRIAADRAGRGARLACAIDASLLEQIASACAGAKLRLRSVRPYLAAVANRVRQRVRQPNAWLAALEGDVCALALLQSGQWRHVACARLSPAAGASLFSLLRQQALMLADAGAARQVYVCGAGAGLAAAPSAADWQVDVLSRAGGASAAALLQL